MVGCPCESECERVVVEGYVELCEIFRVWMGVVVS